MDTDDLEPIKKPKNIDFDTLSIEELEEYKSKGEDRMKAEDLFKK